MPVHDQSATPPGEGQPDEDAEYVGPYPATTLVKVEVEPHCGARIPRRPGEICMEPPVAGRRRCRVHGGLTPTGRNSPHFISGRHSRYPVPLTVAEQARYAQHKAAVYDQRRDDLAGDLALARIMYERAVSAGTSGVAEATVVARLALAHARITSGRTIRVVADEQSVARMMNPIIEIIERRVSDTVGDERAKDVLAHIARDVLAIDWSTVPPPTPA